MKTTRAMQSFMAIKSAKGGEKKENMTETPKKKKVRMELINRHATDTVQDRHAAETAEKSIDLEAAKGSVAMPTLSLDILREQGDVQMLPSEPTPKRVLQCTPRGCTDDGSPNKVSMWKSNIMQEFVTVMDEFQTEAAEVAPAPQLERKSEKKPTIEIHLTAPVDSEQWQPPETTDLPDFGLQETARGHAPPAFADSQETVGSRASCETAESEITDRKALTREEEKQSDHATHIRETWRRDEKGAWRLTINEKQQQESVATLSEWNVDEQADGELFQETIKQPHEAASPVAHSKFIAL